MSQNISIVDRVVERLKTQPIGDLITEEDLHDIVKEAIPKTFFSERRDPKDTSTYNPRMLPPLIIEIMQETLKAHAKQAVDDWMKDNPEIVVEYWKNVCDDKLLTYVNKIMDERATASIKPVLRGMVDQMNAERARMGAPPINSYF